MTTRTLKPRTVRALTALDHAIDGIDCEDLHHAPIATLAQVRESVVALLAAIEAEAEFRTPRASVTMARRRRISPAWTTAGFRFESV